MAEIKLEIISPSRILFEGEVDSITVPGTSGSFQILKNHAPIVSTLEIGELKFNIDGITKHYAISGGTIEVNDNKVLILADSVEDVEEIDIDRAIKSKERAVNRLNEKSSEIDIERARASLARALNRIKLKETYIH